MIKNKRGDLVENVLGAIVIGILSPSPKKSILAVMLIIIIGVLMNFIFQLMGVITLSEGLLGLAVFTDPSMQEALKTILFCDGLTNILVYGAVSVLFSKYQLKYRSKRKK